MRAPSSLTGAVNRSCGSQAGGVPPLANCKGVRRTRALAVSTHSLSVNGAGVKRRDARKSSGQPAHLRNCLAFNIHILITITCIRAALTELLRLAGVLRQ